jgi:glycogen debranching enzyme
MASDMWSGWGIRTLSSLHKSFNPYAYQLGSVWPHDNALIALGFKRYGFHAEAAQVARAISGAASYFQGNQLPELYAGTPKEDDNFPVQYIGANVPQAWSAGSAFGLLKAMLGLAPDAPRNRVYVDPALPAWLPDVTLANLRIGRNSLSVRFWLEGTETRYEVLAGDASIIERRPFGEAWGAEPPGLACT